MIDITSELFIIDQIIRQLNNCDDVVAPADFCENDANQDVTATATE
jgi:hypothetical protein